MQYLGFGLLILVVWVVIGATNAAEEEDGGCGIFIPRRPA